MCKESRKVTFTLGSYKKLWLFIAVLCASFSAFAYDFEVDGLCYNIVSIDNNTCEVTASDKKYSGNLSIPAKITYNSREFSVVGIGSKSFYNCSNLNSIALPESILTIGYQAFYGCTDVTTINIPSSVNTISSGAFEGCSKLVEISLPNTLANIYGNVFKDCIRLNTIKLPDNLNRIDSHLFDGCISLSGISIPDLVTSIEAYAFRGCASLENIEMPDNISIIYSNAFDGCSSLKKLMLPNVSRIGSNAFANCTSLSEFGFAADVNTTANNSWTASDQETTIFNNCPNLHKLIVFPSLTEYTKPYEEIIKTYHSWLDEIDIRELELYSPFISNAYSRNVTSKSEKYSYSLILNSLEKIKLNNGQVLSTYSYFDSVRTYFWTLYFKNCNKLNSIICGETPPMWSYTSPDFTNAQYMNTCVYVPTEAIEIYKENKVWKNFWNIKPLDEYTTLIPVHENVNNAFSVMYYLLNGVRISSEPSDGIFIRKQGNTVTKVIK